MAQFAGCGSGWHRSRAALEPDQVSGQTGNLGRETCQSARSGVAPRTAPRLWFNGAAVDLAARRLAKRPLHSAPWAIFSRRIDFEPKSSYFVNWPGRLVFERMLPNRLERAESSLRSRLARRPIAGGSLARGNAPSTQLKLIRVGRALGTHSHTANTMRPNARPWERRAGSTGATDH